VEAWRKLRRCGVGVVAVPGVERRLHVGAVFARGVVAKCNVNSRNIGARGDGEHGEIDLLPLDVSCKGGGPSARLLWRHGGAVFHRGGGCDRGRWWALLET